MTIIEVKNDELLGRTNDGVIAVNFYAMQKQIDDLQKENEELKEKIKKYEDPEDLKLMFMYCDEKAKDKIKELQERINKALKIIDSYELGKYDYSIPPAGIIELREILKVKKMNKEELGL